MEEQRPKAPEGLRKAILKNMCIFVVAYMVWQFILSMILVSIFGIEVMERQAQESLFSINTICQVIVCWMLASKVSSLMMNRFYPNNTNPIKICEQQQREWSEKQR